MTETDRADRAEAAVGTLQTALRQLVKDWRQQAEALAQEPIDVQRESGQHFYRNGQRWSRLCAADELEALLPALEPTP